MGDQARKYVKMKQASYVRQRRMEAVQSQREHKKAKARREARQMPNTPPVEEVEEYEITSVHTNLEYALTGLRRLMATMETVHTHEDTRWRSTATTKSRWPWSESGRA